MERVVYVPSIDPSRALVKDFAGRLAAQLDLQFSPTVWSKLRRQFAAEFDGEQCAATQQCRRSVRDPGIVPSGPILLVDDVADSRWTMTVLGDLLLSEGSGPVYPFVVAATKG